MSSHHLVGEELRASDGERGPDPGGANEKLEAGPVQPGGQPGGQRGVLYEHTLHGGGPVGPQGPQLRAALLLQVADGAKEKLVAGVGRHGCPKYSLEECEDSLQGGVD